MLSQVPERRGRRHITFGLSASRAIREASGASERLTRRTSAIGGRDILAVYCLTGYGRPVERAVARCVGGQQLADLPAQFRIRAAGRVEVSSSFGGSSLGGLVEEVPQPLPAITGLGWPCHEFLSQRRAFLILPHSHLYRAIPGSVEPP